MEPDDRPELDDSTTSSTSSPTTSCGSCSCAAIRRSSPDAQVALTLRLLGGLDTDEIARAFLVPEPTMAQRIVRAKRKLRDNHAAYRIPRPAELPDRLYVVLTAICARSSPRATPRPSGDDARARRPLATRRSGSAGCSSSSCPTSPRPSGCSR